MDEEFKLVLFMFSLLIFLFGFIFLLSNITVASGKSGFAISIFKKLYIDYFKEDKVLYIATKEKILLSISLKGLLK